MARQLHQSHFQDLPGTGAPPDVTNWLLAHGWQNSGVYTQGEPLFSKGQIHNRTWEQAVAYEFFLFVTIGGGHHG